MKREEGIFRLEKYFFFKTNLKIVLRNFLTLSLKPGILLYNNHLNLCEQVESSKCSKNRC